MDFSDFFMKEVPDWNDDEVEKWRFGPFDENWEKKYWFWRDLILKMANHLGIFMVESSEVRYKWFNRCGLTPLCIDNVLFEIYRRGDVISKKDLMDPKMSNFSRIIKKIFNLMIGSSPAGEVLNSYILLSKPLEEKVTEVFNKLSKSNCEPSCILTMEEWN